MNHPSEQLIVKALSCAQRAETKRDLMSAVGFLQQALALDSSNVKVLCLLSEFELRAGNHDSALENAQRAIAAAASDNPLPLVAAGRAYLATGNMPQASQYLCTAKRCVQPDQISLMTEIDRLILRCESFWSASLQGRLIHLERVSEQHKGFILHCRRNSTFHQQYNFFQAATEKAVNHDIKRSQRHPLDARKIDWVIVYQGQPVGLAALVELNMNNSRAELLIGFPDVCSPFISVEASLHVLNFGFNQIGLRKIYSYVYSDNPMSQKNTLHLGFTQEGCLREHVVNPINHQVLDLFVNGMLRDEFNRYCTHNPLYKRYLNTNP